MSFMITKRHVGLGSSWEPCAACIGINEVLGRPFNNRELRRITGYNAVKRASGTAIIRTFETGIGAMVGSTAALLWVQMMLRSFTGRPLRTPR